MTDIFSGFPPFLAVTFGMTPIFSGFPPFLAVIFGMTPIFSGFPPFLAVIFRMTPIFSGFPPFLAVIYGMMTSFPKTSLFLGLSSDSFFHKQYQTNTNLIEVLYISNIKQAGIIIYSFILQKFLIFSVIFDTLPHHSQSLYSLLFHERMQGHGKTDPFLK